MKKIHSKIKAFKAFLLMAGTITLTSCTTKENNAANKSEVDSLRNQITKLVSSNTAVEDRLVIFDTLDFTVFTHQEWARLSESHAKDIKVYWPDGHMEHGIEKHIESLKAMFVYAPDTRVTEHPIKFGSGKYTAVTGTFEGTFTKPMPIGNGKYIQPTGKTVKMPMVTIGVWENGLMTSEYLYWDNATYMKQFGIGN
jgi:Icc-related predicted phosphoesterase